MKQIVPRLLICEIVSFAILSFASTIGIARDDDSTDFRSILSENCFQCHGPDSQTREADLRLDSLAGATADLGGRQAVIPGDIKRSEMIRRIFSDDPDEVMPPPESKLTLTAGEKQILKTWVASGAPYQKHWAFEKPARPKTTGGLHPVDYFIGRKLNENGLAFSAEAIPPRLIRRVTLDLTGLPPTPAEVDAFVADYEKRGDDAYHDLVDRLLDSPRYGEHMALPWLEAARYADTDGYQYDGPRFQWRWRDWVIDAYNRNMPFDQFTIQQLAGDLLPDPTLEQKIATGFNRNHRYNSEAGLVVDEFLLENAVDRVDTTATLWMGLTVGCARCHDHKFDPITQTEYYQLISFFNNVPEAGRAIKSRNSEPVLLAPTKEQQEVLRKKETQLAEIRSRLKPGDRQQQGGLLIDRQLVHHFPLHQIPPSTKSVGQAKFSDSHQGKASLILNGNSSIEIGKINKSLSLRASSRFTISFWALVDRKQTSVMISRQKPTFNRPGVELALVDGKLRFDLITNWLAGAGRVTSISPIPLNRWVHIAITNDGSQSSYGQKIVVNGEIVPMTVGYNTNSNVGGVTEKQPLILGGGVRDGAANYQGAIGDVRLYATDLWPEELKILAAEYGGPQRVRFSKTKTTPLYKQYVQFREELEQYRRSLPTVMVMQESPQPKPTFVRRRGVYNDLGAVVQRDVPAILPRLSKSSPLNRLGFAQWLVSGDHPLTARVAVNRYWQRVFGTGLVKTAEDFGVQGEKPSHPELLDWLATEFVRTGWDVKAMQKLLVTSRAYRQQSRVSPLHLQKDPNNRLLARGPRLRLSAQAIRDQALSVSGLLVEKQGGPSVSPYQPANLWAEMSMGMKYKVSTGEDLYRRSLYTIWKRTVAPPSMALFDAADRESCSVGRKLTNTPLQALTLLNETGFVEAAKQFAGLIVRRPSERRLDFAFQKVTGREPNVREKNILKRALKKYLETYQSDPQAATALLQTGQSKVESKVPDFELAAYTALANVLLNLDEAIHKE